MRLSVRQRNHCETVEERNRLSRSKVAITGACLKQVVKETREDITITHTQLADIPEMNEKTFESYLVAIPETIIEKETE